MKFLFLLPIVLGPLFAQDGGSAVIDFGSNVIDDTYIHNVFGVTLLLSNVQYTWQITRAASGAKTFSFVAYKCTYTGIIGTPINGGFVGLPIPYPGPLCDQLPQSTALTLTPVEAAMTEFNNLAPDVAHYVNYGPFAERVHPLLTLAQPATQSDAQMILFDGITNNIVDVDLTTNAILSQVTIPTSTQVSVFGIVPSVMGASNEVWALSSDQGIFIVDTGAGKLTANIPIPSLVVGNTVPAAIVFTKSGNTALYAVSYYTPDSSGNNGALLVFDVASRTLRSTLLLKYAPTALVMAPDGLTAYLLSNAGEITYYDVLSGTADLSASTYTPGMSGGYPGLGTLVFIHPDGTRLFWNVGTQLDVFDLTTRKVTNQFNSGLPTTSAASIQMSQDGSTVWFANGAGNLAIVDTRYGNVLGQLTASPQTAVYPGPAN
jgi:hypothetical protein